MAAGFSVSGMVVHQHDDYSPYLQTPNELAMPWIFNPAQNRLKYFYPSVKSLDLQRKRKWSAVYKIEFRCYFANNFWRVLAPAMCGRTSPFSVT
jgi:hypothetical protein